MPLPTPIITDPTSTGYLSTNISSIIIKGTTDSGTVTILVNGETTGVSYTPGDTDWEYSAVLESGTNIFNVVAKDSLAALSSAATITIVLTETDQLNLQVSSPTGLSVKRNIDTVEIIILKNPESEVTGYNFYTSEEMGGGLDGYRLLNQDAPISVKSFSIEKINQLEQDITQVSNIRTTTTTEEITEEDYFSYEHNRTTDTELTLPISEPNFYVVTAVAFDSLNQELVESNYSEEISSTPLEITTALKDLQIRGFGDFVESQIGKIQTFNEDVDVKPGTYTRGVHVDPISDEFEKLWILLDFMHRSQSLSTLLDFDDANDDQESDDVLEDSGKNKLRLALEVSEANASQVQDFSRIDISVCPCFYSSNNNIYFISVFISIKE